jgi:hypothetical protein
LSHMAYSAAMLAYQIKLIQDLMNFYSKFNSIKFMPETR